MACTSPPPCFVDGHPIWALAEVFIDDVVAEEAERLVSEIRRPLHLVPEVLAQGLRQRLGGGGQP